ncbi:TPA: hypothetical protein ACX6RX_003224 [Photobacterium damselae]
MSLELSFTLNVDADGLVTKEGADAQLEKIREWLYTPVTTLWGYPAWGNPYQQYKHEPMSISTARAIENSTLLKINQDIENAEIKKILCIPVEKDMYYIGIATSYGGINEVVTL